MITLFEFVTKYSGSAASPTAIQDNAVLGVIGFDGCDANDSYAAGAKIIAQADIPRKVSTSLVKKSILENKVEKAKADLDFLKKSKKIASYKKKKTLVLIFPQQN